MMIIFLYPVRMIRKLFNTVSVCGNLKIDFVKREEIWEILVRSSADDWKINSDTIVQWSPYESEEDLFMQVFPICVW